MSRIRYIVSNNDLLNNNYVGFIKRSNSHISVDKAIESFIQDNVATAGISKIYMVDVDQQNIKECINFEFITMDNYYTFAFLYVVHGIDIFSISQIDAYFTKLIRRIHPYYHNLAFQKEKFIKDVIAKYDHWDQLILSKQLIHWDRLIFKYRDRLPQTPWLTQSNIIRNNGRNYIHQLHHATKATKQDPVYGYKAFYKTDDGKLRCRDYVFDPYKIHTINELVRPCSSGFHFCSKKVSVSEYYDLSERDVVVYKVAGYGVVINEGNKNACQHLEILYQVRKPPKSRND